MLNPQWLRTFSTLVELGNFTRTAERLDLTQAAVSQHVQRLEERLGPLLIRRPRQIELTPAGHALLAYCAEVSAADQRLQQQLSAADGEQGEVSLITPGSIGLALHQHLLDIQQALPGLSIRHRFAPDADVLAAVLDNRFDLGLATLKPSDARLKVERFAAGAPGAGGAGGRGRSRPGPIWSAWASSTTPTARPWPGACSAAASPAARARTACPAAASPTRSA